MASIPLKHPKCLDHSLRKAGSNSSTKCQGAGRKFTFFEWASVVIRGEPPLPSPARISSDVKPRQIIQASLVGQKTACLNIRTRKHSTYTNINRCEPRKFQHTDYFRSILFELCCSPTRASSGVRPWEGGVTTSTFTPIALIRKAYLTRTIPTARISPAKTPNITTNKRFGLEGFKGSRACWSILANFKLATSILKLLKRAISARNG